MVQGVAANLVIPTDHLYSRMTHFILKDVISSRIASLSTGYKGPLNDLMYENYANLLL